MGQLFDDQEPGRRRIELPDAELDFWPAFLSHAEERALFDALRAELPWRQNEIRLYGRRHAVPRLECWIGDEGCEYGYSGLRLVPEPFPPRLAEVRERLARALGLDLNCVLANLYRDGRDSVGWHADDEPELGAGPTIASLSLGATRAFRLRHRERKELKPVRLELAGGDLLVMSGPTQRTWEHEVPKSARPLGPRINLSFRRIETRG